jgi:transposase InsO family protein
MTIPEWPTPTSTMMTAATAAGVLVDAVSWFGDREVAVRQVLSDSSAYCSHRWRDACAELGITVK